MPVYFPGNGLPAGVSPMGIRFDSLGRGVITAKGFELARPDQLFDGSSLGQVVWDGKSLYGLGFSGGARAPQVKQNTSVGARVVSAVRTDASNDYYDMTLPDLASTRLFGRSVSLVAYSSDWSSVAEIGYYQATSGYAKFAQSRWVSSNGTANSGSAIAGTGWRTLFKTFEDMTLSGAPDFAADQMLSHKIRITQQIGRASDITFALVRLDDKDVPTISIVSDDGYQSWYENASPLLADLGLVASIAVIADRVGYNGTFVTWDTLRAWNAAGHNCVTHGVRGGLDSLLNYATLPQMVDDVCWNRDRIIENGCDVEGSSNFYAWPQGNYFTGGNLQDRAIPDALMAVGFRGGRSTVMPQSFHAVHATNPAQKMIIPVIGHLWSAVDEVANIASILTRIDNCAKYGYSASLVFHQVVANPSTGIQISPTNLATILGRVAYWVAQGKVRNVLINKQLR